MKENQVNNENTGSVSVKDGVRHSLEAEGSSSISAAHAKKQALLSKILKDKTKNSSPGVNKIDRAGQLPLSFPQEQLWLISQLDNNANMAYHVPIVFRIKGELNENTVLNVFSILLSRHEILRTNIKVDGNGTPYQYINDNSDIDLVFETLPNDISEDQKLILYKNMIEEFVSKPFDLSNDCLIRLKLIKWNANDHALLLVMHHIVTDAWSMGVLTREFSTLYEALSKGEVNPLAEPQLQYADFAGWQRGRLQGHLLDKLLDYWRSRLENTSLLQFPTDRPRPPVQSYKGSWLALEIPSELTQNLKSLGQRHGCTLFMTLLAAYKTLLHRYTQQNDLCVGTPAANRMQSDFEHLLGFFVNTLALRTEVNGNDTFIELLNRIKQTTLAAYEHQMLPFIKVVEAVQPERSQAYSSIFQTMFILHNVKGSNLTFSHLDVEYEQPDRNTSQFDLTLELQERPDGSLCGGIEYATDLFDEPTIHRFKNHFVRLIKSVVATPEKLLSKLEYITEEEKNHLLIGLNDTSKPYPQDSCIHELFQDQVLKTPSSVAAIFGDSFCTYEELNQKSNQLAHFLIERGVGTEVLVGICMHRSIEMVVAMLAILKAGGAYVPLDPSYPASRLKHIQGDANLNIILTEAALEKIIPFPDSTAIYVDDASVAEHINTKPRTNISVVDRQLTSSNLAYVIYTSGSTGQPKGVMIKHSNTCALYQWVKDTFDSKDLSLVVAATSICFDLSIFEILATLQLGGSILIVDNILSINAHKHSDKISLINTVPSAIKELINANVIPKNIRVINLAGEPLKQELVELLYSSGVPKVFDLYGPSEDTTYSTFSHRLPGVPANIGRPITNTQTFIVDAYGALLPIGGVGELHIGGAGLARGYLNRPELTSEKFIDNPFYQPSNTASSEKLYRTGDLCRYLPDGNIQFLGRLDHQVKIRGFRVELGEIEAALLSHESVKDVVVVARENHVGDYQLVGFVVCSDSVANANLKSYLGNLLPNYMIPSSILILDAMPLTPNGKLDRSVLDSIQVEFKSSGSFEAPRSDLEQQLAEIWANVLGKDVSDISVNDNFFELGGHSLSAMRTISQIQKTLKCSLSVRSLFEHPTIAEITDHIAKSLNDHSTLSVVAHAEKEEAPTSCSQERLWFIDQLDGVGSSYVVSAVYHLKGTINIPAMERAYKSILCRHAILRTRIKVNDNGFPYQSIQSEFENNIEYYQASDWETKEDEPRSGSEELIKLLINKPFKIADENLIRLAFLKYTDQEYGLVLTMHHVITDGWSMGIFMNELSILYNAFSQELENPLKPLEIQYADYSEWQRQHLNKGEFAKESLYWAEQLRNTPVLELPLDRSRPLRKDYQGRWQSIKISRDSTAALEKIARDHGSTLFMVLLSTYYVLLHRYTQQTTICVGTAIANRLRSEFEGLIGPFVNTLALRINIDGLQTFSDVISQVKNVTLSAYENQLLPFEKVVELVQPERSENYSPLFQTVMVLERYSDQGIRIPGVEVEEINLESFTTKFDLTLSFKENEQGFLSGGFEYSTALFDFNTIERLSANFSHLIDKLIAEPNVSISNISFVSLAESQIIEGWNSIEIEYEKEKCIHEIFEYHVSRYPNAVALAFNNVDLSYQELNKKANQLAHFLIKNKAIKPGSLVGICLERSANLIIAILGVLKAGGAYVPLDPNYPPARLQYLLEDASLQTTITEYHLLNRIQLLESNVVCLDNQFEQDLLLYPEHNICVQDIGLTSKNLAYVIYTSGSTGMPKGVMIEHISLHNTIADNSSTFSIDRNSNFLHCVSFAFDAGSWVLWMVLCKGGKMTLIADIGKTIVENSSYVASGNFTHLMMPPSLLAQLNPEKFVGQPVVIVGGDRSSTEFLNKWASKVKLFNAYGPTETSICASIAKIDWVERSHIGRPISNTRFFILDCYGKPVPIGVAGELFIGGLGLARGYLNRPELTAEKFVSNPFASCSGVQNGERLYRTGDLCRFLPDGNVEFLGRLDHQVKIRGFRIELGEIENALLSHSLVTGAVVITRENLSGDKQLVAFVVSDHSVDGKILKAYLSLQLPEYMVPSTIAIIDAMPLTPNGKVDNKALLSIQTESTSSGSYVAPRTVLEQQLVEVWAEVLGREIEDIGVCDNFFELGGHSLLAVSLCMLMKKKLNMDISISNLFRLKTIAELSTHFGEVTQISLESDKQPNEVGIEKSDFEILDIASVVPSSLTSHLGVGLIDKGQVSWLELHSDASLYNDRKVNVGCVSKLFVASIIMMLVEDGALNLDVPICRYISEITFKSEQTLRTLTLRHLLTHRSGIDDSTLLDKRVYENITTTHQFISYLGSLSCRCEPGVVFSYSSLGFYLCAMIIEVITGRPYGSVLEERILKKLNGHPGIDYSFNKDIHLLDLNWKMEGSAYSLKLASDSHGFLISENIFLRFLAAHISPNSDGVVHLHSAEALNEMHKKQFDVQYHPVITSMGIGWQYYSGDVLGHSGRSASDRDGQFLATMHKGLQRSVYLSSGKFPSVEIFESIVSKSYSPNILYNVSRFGGELFNEELLLGTYSSDSVTIQVYQESGLKFVYTLEESDRSVVVKGSLNQVFRGMFSFKSDSTLPYADWFIVFNWLTSSEFADVIKVGKITAYRSE